MLLAENLGSDINWTLICAIIMAVGTLGLWVDSRKQRKTLLEQPVDVQVIKQLHEQFADKVSFDDFRAHVTSRHSQIFNKLETVERASREELDERLLELNHDRQRTMEKLNEQFTFIRENISAINRELQIRHHNK